MIEVNKKAKPFHPCESLLGAELFFKLRRCSLVGRNYYDPSHPNLNKDIVCQIKNTTSYGSLVKMLKKEGYTNTIFNGNLTQFFQHQKTIVGGNDIRLYISPNSLNYENLMAAQEVCKYYQSLQPHNPLDKLIVVELHEIMMKNKTVSVDADGNFVKLVEPLHDEDDGPQLGGWAPAQHHQQFAGAAPNEAAAGAGAAPAAGLPGIDWLLGQLGGGNNGA